MVRAKRSLSYIRPPGSCNESYRAGGEPSISNHRLRVVYRFVTLSESIRPHRLVGPHTMFPVRVVLLLHRLVLLLLSGTSGLVQLQQWLLLLLLLLLLLEHGRVDVAVDVVVNGFVNVSGRVAGVLGLRASVFVFVFLVAVPPSSSSPVTFPPRRRVEGCRVVWSTVEAVYQAMCSCLSPGWFWLR